MTVLSVCAVATILTVYAVATGSAGVAFIAFISLVAFLPFDFAEIQRLGIGKRQDKFVIGVHRHGGYASAVRTVYAVATGSAGFALVAFITLVAFIAFCTVNTVAAVGAVAADDFTEVHALAARIGDDQLTGIVDGRFGNAVAIPSVRTVCAVATGFSGVALIALIAFVAFVALVAFCAVLTVATVLTVLSIGAITTIHADDHTEIGRRPIRIGQNQFAGRVDGRCGNADPVLTVRAVATCRAVLTVTTVRPLDRTKIQLCAACQRDLQLTVCIDEKRLDADTVFAVFAVRAILSILPVFAIGTDHNAQIAHHAVRIGDEQFAACIDLGFCNTNSVGTVFTVGTVFAVDAVLSIGAVRPDDPSEIRALTVGVGQNQFAVRVDLGVDDPNAVRAILTICAVFAVRAVFTVRAVFAVGADHNAQICRRVVRIGQLQLPGCIHRRFCDADAILAVDAVFAVGTVFAIGTVFAVCTDHRAEGGLLTVGIGDDQLAVFVDGQILNADSVPPVDADDLVQIHGLAVGKMQHQTTVRIDIGRRNPNAVFTVGTVFADDAVRPRRAVLAIFARGSRCLATIQHRAVRKR